MCLLKTGSPSALSLPKTLTRSCTCGLLEVLSEVEAVHVCHLGGGDRDAIRQASSKIASENENLEEMLKHDVDALLVSVQNDECPSVLDAAVDADKGALFEKPGALTAERLARNRRGRHTQEG